MENHINRILINIALLIAGVAAVFTGMLLQIEFHMGNHGLIPENSFVFGINYSGWSSLHKISIVILTLLMIYHIFRHWKWYKSVINKRLMTRNKQVLILSLLFVLTALTGFIPWLIDWLNGNEIQRKILIEIHDKLTLLLSVFLLLHVVKRLKWYRNTFEKIINRNGKQQTMPEQ